MDEAAHMGLALGAVATEHAVFGVAAQQQVEPPASVALSHRPAHRPWPAKGGISWAAAV